MSGPISLECSTILPQQYLRLLQIAERSPRRAVALARRASTAALTQPPDEQALAAFILGYALLRWERLDEAEDLLTTASDAIQRLGLGALTLHIQRTVLYLALLRGEVADIADRWAALAAAYDGCGDELSAGRARLGWMIQLNFQERYAAALALAPTVQSLFEQHGSTSDRAWLARAVATALANQGAFDAARSLLDEAATLFTTLGYQIELAKTWIECARVHDLRDASAPALVELQRAYHLVTRLDLPLRMAFCEKNMGWLYTLRGHYDHGIRLSLQARDRFTALRRQEAAAGCDLNLGNVAYYAGLWDIALSAYQRAEQVYADLGFAQMPLICRRNQALVRRAEGNPEEALAYLAALLPVVEQHTMPFEQAETIHARGQTLADMGCFEAAMQDFERAERLFHHLKNDAAAGESRLERGWILLHQGRLAQAEQELRATQPLLVERPIHQWRVDYGLGAVAEQRGEEAAALPFYRSACRIVARLRQRLANEHASSGLFAQAHQLFITALHLAWRQADAATVLELAELQRALVFARTVREYHTQVAADKIRGTSKARSLRAAIVGEESASNEHIHALQEYREQRLHNPHLQGIADDDLLTTFDLATVRALCTAAFPSGWTILAYVPCADLLLTVVVDAETIRMHAVPFDQRLRRLLTRATSPAYRALTYQLEGGTPQSGRTRAWQTLDELGTRLIPADLPRHLHPDHRLLIVAGDVLQQLPWSALRIHNSWLVEQATPHLLPGLLIWPELVKRQPANDAALAIGVHHFGERGPDLPHAYATLDLVEQKWEGRVTRLEEPQVATLLAWAEHGYLRRYGTIHIATHGQLVATSGLLAHLKLADDDLLYDDIARLGLVGALVVLAACEGAASDILPGEEVLSLSRAFLAAGARDVIASQWQIYDNVVLAFLDLLYDELTSGVDGPTAVARAQRQWLAQPHADAEMGLLVQAPLVWASLCALGAGTRHE